MLSSFRRHLFARRRSDSAARAAQSPSIFLGVSQQVFHLRDGRVDGISRGTLNVAIEGHDLASKFGDLSAPISPAAKPGCDHRRMERAVHRVDEQPRTPVGHIHGAAGSRDRAGFSNVLKQIDFAGTKAGRGIEVQAQNQARHDATIAESGAIRIGSPLVSQYIRPYTLTNNRLGQSPRK